MAFFQRTKLDNTSNTTIDPATSQLQGAGNTSVGNVDTNLGAKADAAASSDAGTFSLIALFKRLLAGITDVISGSGIKKITDALPAGTNLLGKVGIDQTTPGSTNGVAIKWIDENGAVRPTQFKAGTQPIITSQDYLLAMAEGDLTGHTPFESLGYTGAFGTGESTVWGAGGLYVFPAAAIQMQVVSSSANDAAAGTGCRTIRIGYLDNLYAPQTEIVTLNGTTPVLTVATNILRANSFRVVTAGTGAVAAGNIQLQAVGGATTYRYLTAGFTRARNATGTVPAGKTQYITAFRAGYGSAANQTNYGRLYLRASQNEGVRTPGIFYPFAEVLSANATILAELWSPVKLVEKVDWKVDGLASASGIASCALRGWQE